MDKPKPCLPPELVDDILSHLFKSLSHPSQVRATQTTIASLSLVNHYFNEQAKKELLRNFPLTTLRVQCAYFKKFAKKHKSKVKGLRFILLERHQFEDPRYLTCDDTEEFFQAVLPDRTFKTLEIDLKPGWAETHYGPHLGLVPFLASKTITSLRQLQSLRILGVAIGVVEAGALPLRSVAVPKSLESLEIDDFNTNFNKTVSGWEKLVSLNLTQAQNWSIPASISSNIQTLQLNLLPILANDMETATTQALQPRVHFHLLTSLTHFHLDFASYYRQSGAVYAQIRSVAIGLLDSFLRTLPTPLETLRLTDPQNAISDILLILGGELGETETLTSLSTLKRLELNGSGSIEWIKLYLRSKGWEGVDGDSLSLIMNGLELDGIKLDEKDIFLDKSTVWWVKEYLKEKGRGETEVAWYEQGAPFGRGC